MDKHDLVYIKKTFSEVYCKSELKELAQRQLACEFNCFGAIVFIYGMLLLDIQLSTQRQSLF